jgi:hypothetical protein
VQEGAVRAGLALGESLPPDPDAIWFFRMEPRPPT